MFFAQGYADNNTSPDNNTANAGNQRHSGFQFNYQEDVSKKLQVNISGSFGLNNVSTQNSTDKQTFLADSSLLEKDTRASNSAYWNYQAVASFRCKLDSISFLNYNLSLSGNHATSANIDSTIMQTIKNNSIYPASSGNLSNKSQQLSNGLNQGLSYTHKLQKGALIFNLGQSVYNFQQNQDLYNAIQLYNPPGLKVLNQHSQDPVTTENYNLSATYNTSAIKGLNLQLNYKASYNLQRSNQSSYDFDPLTSQYDLPDTLTSNRFLNRNVINQLSASFSNTGGGKFSYNISMGAQSNDQGNNNESAGIEINKLYYNIVPAAWLRYAINKQSNLSMDYNGSAEDPAIDQLQPLPDLSNPYQIKKGNPLLHEAFTHNLGIDFEDFNEDNSRSLQINFHCDYTVNPISGSTTTMAGGIQEIEFINLSAIYHVNGQATYGFPLMSQVHGNGNISTGISYGHDLNLINGKQDVVESDGANVTIDLNYHAGNALLMESKASASFSNSQYSLSGTGGSNSLTENYHLNISYTFPFGLAGGGNFDYVHQATSSLPNQQMVTLNAYVEKDLTSKRVIQVRISGSNLLNTKAAITQSAGQNYIQTQQTNALHSLILLSFIYNFRKFKSPM